MDKTKTARMQRSCKDYGNEGVERADSGCETSVWMELSKGLGCVRSVCQQRSKRTSSSIVGYMPCSALKYSIPGFLFCHQMCISIDQAQFGIIIGAPLVSGNNEIL